MATAVGLSAALHEAGWTTSAGFNATLRDQQWFMRWHDGHRTHHLHVVVSESPIWVARLKFRDVLRTDAALAARYARLKQDLADRHRLDREAYTAAKADFVRAVVDG